MSQAEAEELLQRTAAQQRAVFGTQVLAEWTRDDPSNPIRRRFNPAGPNYGPSGLDTPLRDEERREVTRALIPPYAPAHIKPLGLAASAAVSLGGSVAQTSEV